MTLYERNATRADASDNIDVSMEAEESSVCPHTALLSSPPRTSRTISRPRRSGSFARSLFGDEDDDHRDEGSEALSHASGAILKPLDLNSEMEASSSAATHSRQSMRKRQAEHTIGRDLSFEDVEDSPTTTQQQPLNESMSPSTYRSPSTYHHHMQKSPNAYRTLDGRTVMSKNPFSPMCDDSASTSPAKTAPIVLGDSLDFPLGLEERLGGSRSGDSVPFLRHRLHKRDTVMSGASTSSTSSSLQRLAGDLKLEDSIASYPSYSSPKASMESPVHEMEMFEEPSTHKLRRIHEGDDIATAASYNLPQYRAKKKQLQVQTKIADPGIRERDEISPADVFHFPFTSPSSPSAPGAPSKPRTYRRQPPTKYRPVHKPMVPPTPIPDRRSKSRYHEEEPPQPTVELQSRFQNDFDVLNELGNGSFGNVYKVLSRLDGCTYAIKVANRQAKGNADKDRMLKEVYALAALSDQADTATFHIVRYHQAWMEQNRLYIQTELCTTTLAAEMKEGLLSVPRRYKFLREMCLALDFIHRNDMVHLDFKPENVFTKNDQFKLGDFGLVSKVSSHDVEEGDSRYMSKELLSGDHADLTKSDIFSLGITLFEICLGTATLPSNGPEWQMLRSNNLPVPPQTPQEMITLIEQMMDPSYGTRPSAIELLKRPQLLSDEQKALQAERNKVAEANLALEAQTNRLRMLDGVGPPAPRRTGLMVRANTWSGHHSFS